MFIRRTGPNLTDCLRPLETNLVGGINYKIKVIKRTAYRYRDDAHFFLKIRAVFPGPGEEPKTRGPEGPLALTCLVPKDQKVWV